MNDSADRTGNFYVRSTLSAGRDVLFFCGGFTAPAPALRCMPRYGWAARSIACALGANHCAASGSQCPASPLGVCPGTAGRRAQLSSPLARTIRRRTVHSAPTALSVCPGTAQLPSPLARTVRRRAVHSTRAGTRCLPRMGGRSIVCALGANHCAVGSQHSRRPSMFAQAGRLAQLHARSARIIARRGLSTRAGPQCMSRYGWAEGSTAFALGANHCAAGGSQRPDGSWYQPFRSSPTHLIFQSVLPLRLRPVDYLSYRQTSAYAVTPFC